MDEGSNTIDIQGEDLTELPPHPVDDVSKHRILFGVLVMSFASLLLELSLTRLFSVILFYHFAFFAISIALLGLGAGGVFSYLFQQRLQHVSIARLGQTVCILNAALMVGVLIIDLNVPVQATLDLENFVHLTIIYLVSSVPFALTGLFFSALFARRSSAVPQLYAADLIGGSIACMGIVPLLNSVGGPNTIIAAGIAMALGAVLWAETRKTQLVTSLLLVSMVTLLTANNHGRLIDIVYAKGKRRDKLNVEFCKWNAISRVEVDNEHGVRNIVIDADASTYIMARDPNLPYEGTEFQYRLMGAPPAAANWLRPHGEFAIIGPGGGVDVMRAVFSGSPSVTGIEINPLIANDVMRGQYADFSYGLYLRPNVHINVNDGRSWIRNSQQHFDVLEMTLVDTWASTSAGAFALSENNLYTVEAFREYFNHLKPDGLLAITRWEFQRPREALRVVAQAMRALGGGDLRGNFIIIGAVSTSNGSMVTVLAKKSPFTPEEESTVVNHISQFGNMAAIYLPSAQRGDGEDIYAANVYAFRHLIQSGDPEAFAARYPFNVAPVYDNAPFFFFTLKPSHLFVQEGQNSPDWKNNMGVAVLVMLLLISTLAVAGFLIVPLLLARRGRNPIRWLSLLYFIALGIGYIAVEITLIQRLVLFLGHPIYAMTVVVFLMLLSSGLGSIMSRNWLRDTSNLRRVFSLVVGLLVIYYFALPAVLHSLIGLSGPTKILISAVLIVPLGFLMGMPFPSGLRMLGESSTDDSLVELAWAMNAASSVLGSVLSMTLAVQFGLSVTLLCGALAYFIGLTLAGTIRTSVIQALQRGVV